MGFQRFPRFLALGAMLLLPGCEPTGYWDGVPPPQKLESTEQVEEVVLALTRIGTVAESSIERLRLVIGQEQAYGRVSIELRIPPAAAPSLSAHLFGVFAGLGVPADRVRLAVAAPAADGVLVEVRAIRLTVPVCVGVPTDSTGDATPLSMRRYQFGCASAGNFAAMLVDPRDLTAPPATVPGDGYTAEQAIQAMNGKYGPGAAAQKKQQTTSLPAGESSAGTGNSTSSFTSTP